jgi:hypothetical protein
MLYSITWLQLMTLFGKVIPNKLNWTDRTGSSGNKQSPVGALTLAVHTPWIHIFPDPHDVPSAAPPIFNYLFFINIK